MIDISVRELVKSFDADQNLLNGISFDIQSGERVGLLGKNGAGKTTLFKILTGELDYNSGEIAFAQGKKVGLISQIPHYPDGYTVDNVLATAFSGLTSIKAQMEELESQMTEHTPKDVLRQYDELANRYMSINLLLENETDPVVWRGPIVAGAVKQFWTDVCWGDVDYMFVDLPPGTGDVPLTVFQSLPVNGVILVTSPQDLVSMLLPQLYVSIKGIVESVPTYYASIEKWVENILENNPDIRSYADTALQNAYDYINNWANTSLLSDMQKVITTLTTSVYAVIKTLANILIGLVASVYMLWSKDTFQAQAKKMIVAIFHPHGDSGRRGRGRRAVSDGQHPEWTPYDLQGQNQNDRTDCQPGDRAKDGDNDAL